MKKTLLFLLLTITGQVPAQVDTSAIDSIIFPNWKEHDGVYKQTSYQQENTATEAYPFDLYKIIISDSTEWNDIRKLETYILDMELFTETFKDGRKVPAIRIKAGNNNILEGNQEKFVNKWICDMFNHKTIKYGTVVREKYEKKFQPSTHYRIIKNVIRTKSHAQNNKILGVWKYQPPYGENCHYKIYGNDHRIRLALGNQDANGYIETVEYLTPNLTKEGENPCTIDWLDDNHYDLTYRNGKYDNTEHWERSNLEELKKSLKEYLYHPEMNLLDKTAQIPDFLSPYSKETYLKAIHGDVESQIKIYTQANEAWRKGQVQSIPEQYSQWLTDAAEKGNASANMMLFHKYWNAYKESQAAEDSILAGKHYRILIEEYPSYIYWLVNAPLSTDSKKEVLQAVLEKCNDNADANVWIASLYDPNDQDFTLPWIEKSHEKAIEHYRNALEIRGSNNQSPLTSITLTALAEKYKEGEGVQQNDTLALQYYEAARDIVKSAENSFKLAEYYEKGWGTPRNPEKAAELYESIFEEYYIPSDLLSQLKERFTKEAKERNPLALHMAGFIYHREAKNDIRKYSNEYGKEKKIPSPYYDEAVRCWEAAAEKGNTRSMKKLMEIYLEGDGVPVDSIKAWMWARKGAEMGNKDLLFTMAWNYAKGIGVPMDSVEAVRWYIKAANAGHATAMTNLGWCYENGVGCEKDFEKAAHWYQKGAEAGEGLAMNNLGFCYLRGLGVKRDQQEGLKWIQKGAEAGNKLALQNLVKLLSSSYFSDSYQVDVSPQERVAVLRSLVEKDSLNDDKMVHFAQLLEMYPQCATDSTEFIRKLLSFLKVREYALNSEVNQYNHKIHLIHDNFCNAMNRCKHTETEDFKKAAEWMRLNQYTTGFKGQMAYYKLLLNHLHLNNNAFEFQQLEREIKKSKYTEQQIQLGYDYAKGNTVPLDSIKAVEWYRISAENGSSAGAYYLGWCYDNNFGGLSSRDSALVWFEKAAIRGNLEARELMGCFYLYGTHVEKNEEKGLLFLKKNQKGLHLIPYYWKKKDYTTAGNYYKNIGPGISAIADLAGALSLFKSNQKVLALQRLSRAWTKVRMSKFLNRPDNPREGQPMVILDYKLVNGENNPNWNNNKSFEENWNAWYETLPQDVKITKATKERAKLNFHTDKEVYEAYTKESRQKERLNLQSPGEIVAEVILEFVLRADNEHSYIDEETRNSLIKAGYELVLKYNPNHYLCLNNYAYQLAIEKKDLQKAEKMCRKVITAIPDNEIYLDTYAWILYQQGHCEQALPYIKKALEIMLNKTTHEGELTIDPDILGHARIIYQQLGQTDKELEERINKVLYKEYK